MAVVTLAQLLESGVHFGHQTRRWNPRMSQYIFTDRNGVHIIDLVQTAQLLEDAYDYLRTAAEAGKKVLFVGTKRQAAALIAQEASRCGAYYVNQRWLGGMLTNWTTIKTRVERLKELENLEESGNLDLRPKKEGAMLRRELFKLRKYLGGIKGMRKVPDIVVLVDQRREYTAVQECHKLDIPIVSLLDTNCDPDAVDVPIPANDDAIRSIKLILGKLADAIYEGRHGQLDTLSEDDYDDYGVEDFEDEEEEEAQVDVSDEGSEDADVSDESSEDADVSDESSEDADVSDESSDDTDSDDSTSEEE
ncbi:30S ribosomal protein S2 [Leptolyngbya valderiana BDU 20041]|nr:30S ribosomal protein S2 [Geitlerinema sp. CS-897]OAB55551.1 30S ribosomal protein S2 [Leptolyngbya valderiana BDU 20041]PPT07959.1 SSU ribosomal protein S2p (SAe) [Geitlerinema sp. FC II]